jgi:peptidoglycan hydrolase-like protein with peptidoglycan-binding domain
MKKMKLFLIAPITLATLSASIGLFPITDNFVGSYTAEAATNLPGLSSPYYNYASFNGKYRVSVVTIQTKFNNWARKTGRSGSQIYPDGYFGKATDKAIRTFQKANKLEVDGTVGTKTWEKLRRY